MSESPWLTLAELSKYIKISKCTLYRAVNEKQIPFCKWGKLYMFHRDEIDLWMMSFAAEMPTPTSNLREGEDG